MVRLPNDSGNELKSLIDMSKDSKLAKVLNDSGREVKFFPLNLSFLRDNNCKITSGKEVKSSSDNVNSSSSVKSLKDSEKDFKSSLFNDNFLPFFVNAKTYLNDLIQTSLRNKNNNLKNVFDYIFSELIIEQTSGS